MNRKIKGKRIGIDVGGTFTDLVLIDFDKGAIDIEKTLTTPDDPTIGIMDAYFSLMGKKQSETEKIEYAIHGTTLVTNTIIERKGAKTGLITTMGHRDTLEIGNELRYDLYDLFLERPKPLVDRFLRKEIKERINSDGIVLLKLNKKDLNKILNEFKQEKIEVIAVCLLHSYANPLHEIEIKKFIKNNCPEFNVIISSEVAPEIREFERTTTTILNAYTQPTIKKYLRKLEKILKNNGLQKNLYVMLSSGGITTVKTAEEIPIRLIESGPAAGALAACYYSKLIGLENVISFDMGGTTAKICIIDKGIPSHSTNFETDRVHRFKKGSGLPVKVPVIDMIEIGAGGGSMSYIDNMRLLKVGPISAGSSPGPACYGFGGEKPTVTDADLILGYLDQNYFLGGEILLNKKAAYNAIEKHIAEPLKIDVVRAAVGIYDVVNENMASAARVHISEKARDPRNYSLIAFGGAGPVHAYRVAQLLGIKQIICPFGAGTSSAFGLLASPIAFDFVKTYVSRLEQIDWKKVDQMFTEMEYSGRSKLISAGVKQKMIKVKRQADIRYVGQGSEISVAISSSDQFKKGLEKKIKSSFYEMYKNNFGAYLRDFPIEVVNWRVEVSGPKPKIDVRGFKMVMRSGAISYPKDAIKTLRPVYFTDFKKFYDTPVYDRYGLTSGMCLKGPAIVEERESTVVVGKGGTLNIDKNFNIVINLS